MKVKNLIICMSLLLAQPAAVYAEDAGNNQPGSDTGTVVENGWESTQYESKNVWQNDREFGGISSQLHYLQDLQQYEKAEYIVDYYVDNGEPHRKTPVRKLVVERYDDHFQFLKSKEIERRTYKLPDTEDLDIIWGGIYYGDKWNFVAVGQDNFEEDPDKKVIRVTRYTKDWEYSDAVEISNGNVRLFFDGIAWPFYKQTSMTEVNNQLWLHFARLLYKDEEGTNHQANFDVKIDENTMQLLYKGDPAYVSHSEAQLIRTYDNFVYTVDVGDGYPRAVCLQQIDDNNNVCQGANNILNIYGGLADTTGVKLGGFEIGNDGKNFLVAGSTVDQSKDPFGQDAFNVFLKIIQNGYKSEPKTITFTNFQENKQYLSGSNPYLVKINENKFLVLWTIQNGAPGRYNSDYVPYIKNDNNIYFAFVNADGEQIGDVNKVKACLGCQPIVVNNKVVWYTTGVSVSLPLSDVPYADLPYEYNSTPTFYCIDVDTGQLEKTGYVWPDEVFTDVNIDTPHVEHIEWMYGSKISEGWLEADGTRTYRPMNAVVRQDMAAFLRREAVKLGVGDAATWKPSAPDWKIFKDVNKSTPHAEDILWLAHAGISTGWTEADGTKTYRGMDTVKRQDMAAFLYRLADSANLGTRELMYFPDVSLDDTPHSIDIFLIGGLGITKGYPDGTFRGMLPVYRQDMAAFIHRLDNLKK